MSGRPWLEALKATMGEQGTDTEKPLEKILEALPSEGCERCESPADRPTPIVDLQTTDKRGPWGKEERRLTAAGWKPKERCGKTIYQSPKRGFWYSQKIALHLSESGSASS